MNDMTPAIGHNVAPADADPLRERLQSDHEKLVNRRDELLAAVTRAPTVVETEDDAKRMADFAQQLLTFVKEAKAIHQSEKAPYLEGGRTVDSFLHTLIDDIDDGKKEIDRRRKIYADAKAAEERRRREEEARKAREAEEAARKAAEEAAAALQNETDLQQAIEAEEQAEAARKAAENAAREAAAKPAELGRTRGDCGGITTLKRFWNWRQLDRDSIDLDALRQHLPIDAIEKALRSWISANKEDLEKGTVKLTGVEIFEDTRL